MKMQKYEKLEKIGEGLIFHFHFNESEVNELFKSLDF